MANYIELIQKYSSQAWDKTYKRESISSLFDAGEGLFKFTGAKTVKIATWQAGGLSDYSRNNDYTGVDEVRGYRDSTMQLVWNEYTIDQDRGARIPIEKFDDEETDGLALGATTTELSRLVIIPEVDAYFFSKVYQEAAKAGTGNIVTTAVGTEPLKALNAGLTYLDNMEVGAENQVIALSPNYLNLLRNSTELTKFMTQGDYDKNVSFKMTEYEGRKLVVVPPARFNTNVELHENGFSLKGQPIDFMILPKDAVTHIVKYNKVKVLDGDLALAASNQDGFVVYARVYHDTFVTKNKRLAIYAHVSEKTGAEAELGKDTVNMIVNKDGKIAELVSFPPEKLVHFAKSTTAVTVGSTVGTIDSTNFLHIGDTAPTSGYIYTVDSNRRVLAVKQLGE